MTIGCEAPTNAVSRRYSAAYPCQLIETGSLIAPAMFTILLANAARAWSVASTKWWIIERRGARAQHWHDTPRALILPCAIAFHRPRTPLVATHRCHFSRGANVALPRYQLKRLIRRLVLPIDFTLFAAGYDIFAWWFHIDNLSTEPALKKTLCHFIAF